MKLLIRTFPPESNPNYGGILQAWALQQVLVELGHEPAVDSTRSNYPGSARAIATRLAHNALDAFPALLIPRSMGAGVVSRSANVDILKFPRERIRTVAVYRRSRTASRKVYESFEGFVVGSDQVWRADYVDVSSFLLDFLPDNAPGPRVAYAASFGVDEPLDLDLASSTAQFAKRFTAISVREDSGVELCRLAWGVDAVQMPDPTLLLSVERYSGLAEGSSTAPAGLVSYVLDRSDASDRMIDSIRRQLGVVSTQMYQPLADNVRAFRSDKARYRRPGIETWLDSIMQAQYVVTDSYHGTIFSILFNRPFLVRVNERRGAARFLSLLRILGLEDRVAADDGNDVDRLIKPIDWVRVSALLARERARGREFLARALAAVEE